MKKYAVYGASGFGREVMPLMRQQLKINGEQFEVVFLDDAPLVPVQNGHRVISYTQWMDEPGSERYVVIAIANSSVREKIANRCIADGVGFYEIISENAVVLDDVAIDIGAVISPFVTVTSNVRIGKHFHANLYSYVAHDCRIGDYVTFAPGVKCNGNVVIEDHVYIGTGAIIRQGTTASPVVIGRGAIVGMGAVVTKSVPPGVTVVGNPAKLLVRV